MAGNWQRTINCGALTEANVDTEVTLNGWVHRQRDFGGSGFY